MQEKYEAALHVLKKDNESLLSILNPIKKQVTREIVISMS